MNTLGGLDGWFKWLLQTSWQAAVLAALILLAQFFLRNRLSPRWRHGLWLLLVVRLLTPVMPSSNISIFNLAKASRSSVAPAAATLPRAVEVDAGDASTPVPPVNIQIAAPAPEIQSVRIPEPTPGAALSTIAAHKPPSARPLDWMRIAAGAWLAGVCVLMVRFAAANYRFARRLARCVAVQEDAFTTLFQECADSLGVKQRVLVIETDYVQGPAVYGLFRKRLLLPKGLRGKLTTAQLRHVLRHELAHIKRRDAELNCLVSALQILHWFNPVLWFAFGQMRADRELATDEVALAHTQGPERSAYGETILTVLESLHDAPSLPGLIGVGESKAEIGRRIRAIARGSGGPGWRWAGSVIAVVIAGITLTSAREEQSSAVDLLQKYPTTLTAGDAVPDRARPWQFKVEDIFQLTRFSLEVGTRLRVEAGASDLGIGHCADGAVWAVVLPREDGKLSSSAASGEEKLAHVWLRFHPSRINRIFPPETVSGAGRTSLENRMRGIADAKFRSSWHAGMNAMIPEPKDITVDADTKNGLRRFFVVDTAAKTAEYVAAFADRPVKAAEESIPEAETDTNCASVVSVMPPNGAGDVEWTQPMRIRFDRPMNPYTVKLEWIDGGFQPNGPLEVSADRTEFVIPLRLAPGQKHTIALNRDPQREMWARMGKKGKPEPSPFARGGFKDAGGAVANEFRWSFSTKELPRKGNAPKPRVAVVSPPSGTTTPLLTLVEITFDQPMRPIEYGFPYLEERPFAQGPTLIPSIEYDSKQHRFRIPALLRAEDDVRLTLKGFYSADGVLSDPVVLHYQTETESLDPKYLERSKAAATDPKLQQLLTKMKEARAGLNSGVETVQSIQLRMTKGVFNNIEAQTATFRWEGPDKAYADITGPMTTTGAFILGCDGVNCWLYSENEKGEKRLDRTPVSVTERDVYVVDPFNLRKRSVQEVLAQEGLVLAGNAQLEGHPCYRLEKWEVNQHQVVFASLKQWWIDEQTLLPRQIVSYSGNWCQIVRFDYSQLNQHLADSAFQPPAVPGGDAKPLFFDKEPTKEERRFLKINDGSDGRMSGRLGWRGPGGTTSSGLN